MVLMLQVALYPPATEAPARSGVLSEAGAMPGRSRPAPHRIIGRVRLRHFSARSAHRQHPAVGVLRRGGCGRVVMRSTWPLAAAAARCPRPVEKLDAGGA